MKREDDSEEDIHLLQLSVRKKVVRYAKYQYSKNTKLIIIFFVFLILVLILVPTVLHHKQALPKAPVVPQVDVDVNGDFIISTSNDMNVVGKKAFVTLFIAAGNAKLYFGALILWIMNLRHFNFKEDIVVLITDDIPQTFLDVLNVNDVKTKVVPKLTSTGTHEWYKHMVTKYALWAMTEYDQIAYYDSDHVFLKSPENVFNDCGDHPFCAVQDVGIGVSYLNAGFMVIHPNLTVFQHLKDLSYLANDHEYAEQDQFNIIFKGKWKVMSEIYNMQWVEKYHEKLQDPNGISVHEKFWRFKLMGMDDPKYIWNRLKSNFTFKSTFDFAFPTPK